MVGWLSISEALPTNGRRLWSHITSQQGPTRTDMSCWIATGPRWSGGAKVAPRTNQRSAYKGGRPQFFICECHICLFFGKQKHIFFGGISVIIVETFVSPCLFSSDSRSQLETSERGEQREKYRRETKQSSNGACCPSTVY